MKRLLPILGMVLFACGTQADGDLLSSSGAAASSSGSSGMTTSSSGGTGSSSSGGAPVDAGSSGNMADAAVVVDAGPGAFEGAAAFVDQAGGNSRKGGHNFAGNTPTSNPAKAACLSCHSNAGGETPFSFGGTVFKDSAGTMPLANAEIRVRNAGGQAVLVHTDQYGNFFSRANVTFPAKTGARTATATKLMSADITSGDCNKCHNGTTTAFAYVN